MKDIFIDWKRPFAEASKNSMDFEPAKEFVVYISYYYDKDTETAKNVYGNMGKKDKIPVFETIYLQNLDIVPDAPLVSPYKVKSGAVRDVTLWGSALGIAAATYAMF